MRSLVSGAAAVLLLSVVVMGPACSTSDGGAGVGDPLADGGPLGDGYTPLDPDGSVPPKADAGDGAPGGPTCDDQKKDGDETDVDCGGSCPKKCKALQSCLVLNDCTTGLVCIKKTCSSPSANDGIKDGDETDIDCGGKAAPPCDVGKGCLVGLDCVQKVCDGTTCLAPTATDGVKNGDETDVDCGGGTAPACVDGKKCAIGARDCTSKVCTGNTCIPPTPNDGVKNGNETDIDCGGGPPAPACGTGKTCITGAQDCVSYVCTGGVCQAATGTDGVKNGDESDIDCGGTNTGAPKCDPTYACNGHADCKSDGCDYNGKCAAGRSCTQHLGGDTCGTGEVGQAGAAHESCCLTAPLTASAVTIDKYFVTAGRMRAFINRLAGNVRAFAPGTPGWLAAWNPLVPSTIPEANVMLGSYWNGAPNDSDGNNSKRSCQTVGFGGHTYYTTGAGELGDYTQAELDPKALNCVGWHIAKAFCAWDGGRLPTLAELSNAFTNNSANAYPWQFADASPYSPTTQDPRLNHVFSYGWPGNNPRRVPAGTGTVQDITWYVSPPGRFPTGANANGVQDIAGDLLHWTDNGEYLFTWTMSWENHAKNLAPTPPQNWKTAWPGEPNGYYGIGLRCVH